MLPAIESGVLEMHPILQDDDLKGEFSDAMANRFLDRIREVMNSPGVYPSLDDEVAKLTRSAIAEGLIDPAPHYARRAKNSGVGLGLLGNLPHFPRADISEILDVRKELTHPLGMFRRAVTGLQAGVQVEYGDPDFGPQVDELYVSQVRPALDEIDQLVHDNLSLRELATRAATG
ncbi:hypothetical protein E1218_07475 [Kribbella turkmenica]|uniref:Uncharacterized protein n=1 Tax=Kribbella turkmenica TaxID=2530375 RepID=A0A4R4XCB8_9ACTN|nr:hypothetical protein [Kribbella turkmenica]TDD28351.1 hypothetical protein E1218_07475 [Kribbella turkmenica]